MEKYHTTKDGKRIKISELNRGHLENIVKLIERKSIEGFVIRTGESGPSAQDMDYAETTLYGEEAKNAQNFNDYMTELNKRRSMDP